MRKLFYFIPILLFVAFTSCSKDDDKGSSGDIIGKWDLEEMTMEGTFEQEGMTMEFTGKSKNIQGENYVIFNEDNTLEGKNSEFEMEIEFNFMGQTITQTFPAGNDLPESGTWERNGNKIVITSDSSGERVEYDVKKQTSNTLVLTADESAMELGEDLPEGSKFSVTITFKR